MAGGFGVRVGVAVAKGGLSGRVRKRVLSPTMIGNCSGGTKRLARLSRTFVLREGLRGVKYFSTSGLIVEVV